MAKIFDYVVKYYEPNEVNGRVLLGDDRWNFVREWAYYHAGMKLKELLGFGEPVTIEPLKEAIFTDGGKIAMNGYKVTAQGTEYKWRIEPRVREQKSQAWRGL